VSLRLSLFSQTELSELSNQTNARTIEGSGKVPRSRAVLSNPLATAGYQKERPIGKRLETIISESASATLSADYGKQVTSFDQDGGHHASTQPRQGPPAHQRAMDPHADPMEERHSPENTPQSGLYDVFAPAGPIGIVVDTTKHGPAVHSLKRTSPMLGLINPGDLIVALDDEDTRGMTAATLTRLMARKSSQKERKITLLTNEPY
jgi:hypothetical protein